MEGNTAESPVFDKLLEEWDNKWDGHESCIRLLYGYGYRGELMVVEREGTTVVTGTIVPGTAPFDRQTNPTGIERPTPAAMPVKVVRPEVRLQARKRPKEIES